MRPIIKTFIACSPLIFIAACSNPNVYHTSSPNAVYDENGQFHVDKNLSYTFMQLWRNDSAAWSRSISVLDRDKGFPKTPPTRADLSFKTPTATYAGVPQNVSAIVNTDYLSGADLDVYDQTIMEHIKYNTHFYGHVTGFNGIIEGTAEISKNNAKSVVHHIILQNDVAYFKQGSENSYLIKNFPFVETKIIDNLYKILNSNNSVATFNGKNTVTVKHNVVLHDKAYYANSFTPSDSYNNKKAEDNKPNETLNICRATAHINWHKKALTNATMTYKLSGQYVSDYCKMKLINIETTY